MKFFTSDEHYGHVRIIEFCKRPFRDIYEMREALIAAHNAKVGRGDITFHLGDIFWRTMSVDEAMYIMGRLNGQHKLVLGNHEELILASPDLRGKFLEVADVIFLETTRPKMYLHHYACRVWRDSHKGSYHLYGHSHAALPEANTLSFDCGVDSRPDYAPWSEEEVASKMKSKKAAGAIDEMEKEIRDNPWNKAEAAQVLYPAPQIPQAVWDALKESERKTEEAVVPYPSYCNIHPKVIQAGNDIAQGIVETLSKIPQDAWETLQEHEQIINEITHSGRCVE